MLVPEIGDPAEWETVEIAPIAPVAATRHPRMALAGVLLILGAVVGAGFWPTGSAGPAMDLAAGACPPPAVPPIAAGVSPSGDRPTDSGRVSVARVIERTPAVVVLMPAPGEVILGAQVVVAGRLNGARRGPAETAVSWLHVVIVAGQDLVGKADFEVIGTAFAGSIPVAAQARGKIVELRVSDRRRPSQVLMTHQFVLGPRR